MKNKIRPEGNQVKRDKALFDRLDREEMWAKIEKNIDDLNHTFAEATSKYGFLFDFDRLDREKMFEIPTRPRVATEIEVIVFDPQEEVE